MFFLGREEGEADLMEIYKIMRGIDRVESRKLILMLELFKTRGHSFRIRVGGLQWTKK